MALKVVIVGGVAGGASAAARLRRLDENAEIIIFEKGEFISFANCGLPYYVGGVITKKERLVVQTPESMKRRFNIDVRTNSEVISINPAEKTVVVHDHRKNTRYTESYDKLILSPGARPVLPDIEGINSERVFTLRDIPDTYRLRNFVEKYDVKRAVLIGAGFIGLEVAENLHSLGVEVAVVELANQVLGPLDFEMAALVHQHLKSKGVELYLGRSVKAIEDSQEHATVVLNDSQALRADMVVFGTGVRPEAGLAARAGLKLGVTGGILVDEYMRTSDPDIYAVGDAVEVKDFVTGDPRLIPLAGPANKQGRIAADNICGRNEKYEGTQGTSIVKVFDMTVAVTGNNERLLSRKGTDYEKYIVHASSHAEYYPGATPMAIKLIFSKKNGKILGAQIVGYEGVDKRIDVISTAMRAKMTVYDLQKLELAYAPPYSSARDPVNIAGYTASNILKGDVRVFHWDQVSSIDRSQSVLLDVRTPREYMLGTIEGAVNIPLDELRGRLSEIPRDKSIYVFCHVGLRGYLACRILYQNGYSSVYNLSGGWKTYASAVLQRTML